MKRILILLLFLASPLSAQWDVFGQYGTNGLIWFDALPYDPDAVTIFNSFVTTPSPEEKTRINDLVVYLKGTGDWAKIDVLWVMAGETQQAGQINWKSPDNYTLTLVNSPTFTADEGFTGNGTTMYINTNWTPSTNGVNYTQNSGGFTVFTRSTGTTTGVIGGTSDGAGVKWVSLIPTYTDNNLYARLNNVTAVLYSASNATFTGIYSVLRTTATNITVYRNGSTLGDQTKASDGLSTKSVYLLALNNNGTAGFFTDKQISIACIHSGTASASNLSTAFETYMDSKGKGVIP